jgi:Electron transfer DM13
VPLRSILRTPRLSILLALVLVALAAVAFGYFEVHKLFIDDRVGEAFPVFEAPTPPDASPLTSQPAQPSTSPTTIPETVLPNTASVASAPPPSQSTTPTVVTEYSGSFRSLNHATSGAARVFGNGTGQRFLRFETFATENGPDVNVYLVNSSTSDVSDSIDLGDLKGNIGDQNYEIPHDVDLNLYDTVLIWCVRFSSGFGEATLSPV